VQCLDILSGSSTTWHSRSAGEGEDEGESGSTSPTPRRSPKVFDTLYVQLVGRRDRRYPRHHLNRLAQYIEKNEKLKSR